ncbi:hypothetical protein N825_27215 [Skermanella stibiiresistens SB22]|uniref:Uncharacterized protein n=1 Tax=Skermanella stibiiresistens SB22 TaxID=1385369 RepID=W9HC62_9PROT|nr:hypothetical protein [Skermanella stibiiresistens]EWY41473.1 hypothetical protein N825_27215 [Skermanella stibiiresistens SB22]
MVDAIPASDRGHRRYLDSTPEHPYIPYDTPSAYGRMRVGRTRMGGRSGGGISDVIREHPVPFVLFAASAGILLAAWLGYRLTRDDEDDRDEVTVGWAMPDGSASHSDTVTNVAADTLGQTGRDNPPRVHSAQTLRSDKTAPIFDRP